MLRKKCEWIFCVYGIRNEMYINRDYRFEVIALFFAAKPEVTDADKE